MTDKVNGCVGDTGGAGEADGVGDSSVVYTDPRDLMVMRG